MAGILLLKARDHLSHQAVFLARRQHFQTSLPRAPLEDIDIDMTHSPPAHFETTRFVEIDRVGPNQRGAVIIDYVLCRATDDAEPRAEWITRPIARRAHDVAAGKMRADRITTTALFSLRVGGGTHFLNSIGTGGAGTF